MLLRGAPIDTCARPGQAQTLSNQPKEARHLQTCSQSKRSQQGSVRRRETQQICQAAAAEDTGYGSEWATPEDSYLVVVWPAKLEHDQQRDNIRRAERSCAQL